MRKLRAGCATILYDVKVVRAGCVRWLVVRAGCAMILHDVKVMRAGYATILRTR